MAVALLVGVAAVLIAHAPLAKGGGSASPTSSPTTAVPSIDSNVMKSAFTEVTTMNWNTLPSPAPVATIEVTPYEDVYLAMADSYIARKKQNSNDIKPYAGSTSSTGYVDGGGISCRFDFPGQMRYDNATGELYVLDADTRIRRILDGTCYTFAGNSNASYADGPLLSSSFNAVKSLSLHPPGASSTPTEYVFVADQSNHAIRLCHVASGQVTTLAGNGISGWVDGIGSVARLKFPQAVVNYEDSNSNNIIVYAIGLQNKAIRRINVTTKEVTTLAWQGSFASVDAWSPKGMTIDSLYNPPHLYISESTFLGSIIGVDLRDMVRFYTAGNGTLGSADGRAPLVQFAYPDSIKLYRGTDNHLKIFVADSFPNKVRVVTEITTASPTTTGPTTHGPTTQGPTTCAPTSSPSSSPSTATPSSSPSTATPSSSPSTATPSFTPSTVSPSTFSPTKVGPTPISAQFSNTYQSVRISFHRNTNQPAALTLKATCDALLQPFSVALLGTNYGCYWEGPKVFVVTLGEGFLLVPGNALTLVKSTIQAENNALEKNGDSAVVVSRASTNIDVSVVIVGETVIGTCGGVAELTANGEGSIAKPFTYTWSIVNNTGLDWEKSLNALAQQTTTSVLALNGSMIPLGANVTVAVSVKNWLNDSATAQFGLSKVGTVVPSLTLPSSSNITARRSRQTDINVQVRTPKCLPNLRVDAFWSQVTGPHAISITNTRSAYLRIPAFSLDVLATYQLRFVARAVSQQTNATLGQQSVDFYLKVENEDLEATIAGGSSRTIPVSGNAYDINFDASASIDPAYPLAASGLSFNWSLFQVVSSSLTPVSLSSSSGATLSLSTAQLSADSEYLMRVNVSTNRSQSITAVASQTIITTSLPAPRVTLGVNLDKRVQDPHKKLVLNGRAARDDSTSGNDDPSLALSWSSDATDFNISDRANLRSAIDARDLVIAPNVLIPGKTYKFTVQSTVFAGGAAAVGSASISVRVNSPPGSGSCASSPDVGVALETDFILSCEGFVDDAEDLPLRFKYQSVNGENAAAALASPATYTATQSSTYLDICRFRDLQSYKTKLAAPLGSSSPRLLVRAIVSDDLGSEGYYYFALNVTQPTTLNLTKSSLALTERLEEGDTQSFVTEVAALASFLSSDSGLAQTTDSSAADEREDLLNKVASVSVTNPSSGESSASSLSAPVIASLAEILTAASRPAEITTNVKSKTLDLLGAITNSFDASSTAKATGDEGDTVASASGAISNLLTAASNNTGTTAATNTELANAERLEKTLSDLSTMLSVALIPGEDQVVKGQQNSTGKATVSISSRVMKPDEAFNTTLTSIDGATVSFELLNVSSSGGATGVQLGFIAVTGGRGGSLFPFTSNITSAYTSGLSIVEVKEKTLTGVRELAIADKSVAPFLIQVPTDGDGDSLPTNSDGTAAVRQCVFWSNVTGHWSTEGVEYKGLSADGSHKCESTHLSSFSTQPAFQVEVNTFSASDASNVNAYDPSKNPAMALTLILIGILILLLPLTYYIDKRTAVSKELILKNELEFYRGMNYTRKMHYEDPRSLQNWKESIKLAMRRRHPWLSLCIRMSGDFIDSRKRLLILATITFNAAAVCALLVGTEQKLGYIQGNIATAIVAMLIGYPIPYVITSIFARETPHNYKVKFTPVGLVAAMPWLFWVASVLMGEFDVGGVAVEDEDDAGADDDPDQRDRMDDNDDEDGDDNDDDDEKKRNKNAAMAGSAAGGLIGMSAAELSKQQKPRRQKSEAAFKSSLNLNTSVQSLNQVDLKNQSDVSNVGESQRLFLRTGTSLGKTRGGDDDGKEEEEEEEMVPITCCGIVIAQERANMNYSQWNFLDFVGATICVLAVIGCAFIVVVLAYQSVEKDGTDWDIVTSALLTWPQDLGARIVTIVWLEAVLTAPLIFIFFPCCAVCGFCSSGTDRIDSEHTYTFDADEGVCNLDKNNFVTRLYPQAKEAGVKVGWRLIRMGDASVSTKQESIDQLRRIHAIHRYFDITFDPSAERVEGKA